MLGLDLGLGLRLGITKSLNKLTFVNSGWYRPVSVITTQTHPAAHVHVHSVCTHTHTYVGIHHSCYPTWFQNLWSVTFKYLSTSEPSLLCITQIPTWIPTNDEVFFFLIVYCPTSEDTMACIHNIVDAYTWTINGPHLSVKRQVCTRFIQSYPLRRTHTTLVELSAIVDYGNQWYPVTAEFHRGF